jgi:hypothetical protein
MSIQNIESKYFGNDGHYFVTFRTPNGLITYRYTAAEGSAIQSGHDPRKYRGQKVSEDEVEQSGAKRFL